MSRMLRVMFANGLFERKPHAGGGAGGYARAEGRGARGRHREHRAAEERRRRAAAAPRRLHSIAVIGPERRGGAHRRRRQFAGASELRGRLRSTASASGPATGCRWPMRWASPSPARTPARIRPRHARLRRGSRGPARKADVAIVVVGNAPSIESEGFDRKTLGLPAGQDELIQAVAKANTNTIVVINAGSPVAMDPWLDQVPAVLNVVRRAGRRPRHRRRAVRRLQPVRQTAGHLPEEMKDTPAWGHYPGENMHIEYAEGIYVGYRHFDKREHRAAVPVRPRPVVHQIRLQRSQGDARQDRPGQPVQVSLKVRNSGPRAGAEVVQLYVRDVKSSLDRPLKELKAFERVELKPGEARTVAFKLDKSALSYFDPAKKSWVAEPGAFEVQVGSSSRDIKLKGSFELAQ